MFHQCWTDWLRVASSIELALRVVFFCRCCELWLAYVFWFFSSIAARVYVSTFKRVWGVRVKKGYQSNLNSYLVFQFRKYCRKVYFQENYRLCIWDECVFARRCPFSLTNKSLSSTVILPRVSLIPLESVCDCILLEAVICRPRFSRKIPVIWFQYIIVNTPSGKCIGWLHDQFHSKSH